MSDKIVDVEIAEVSPEASSDSWTIIVPKPHMPSKKTIAKIAAGAAAIGAVFVLGKNWDHGDDDWETEDSDESDDFDTSLSDDLSED